MLLTRHVVNSRRQARVCVNNNYTKRCEIRFLLSEFVTHLKVFN